MKNLYLFNHLLFAYIAVVFAYGCNKESTVQKILSDINEISFAKFSWGEGFIATDVVVNSRGDIYISDGVNSRVVCFDQNGTFLRQIGKRERHWGEIQRPIDMAIDTQDKLYIACRDSVLIFDEYGQRFGQFAIDISPHNISVDPAGNIYLAGYQKDSSIHRYDRTGEAVIVLWGCVSSRDPIIEETYSDSYLGLNHQALIISYSIPYHIIWYDFDQNKQRELQRSEISFEPNFEISEGRYIFKRSGKTTGIEILDGEILNFYSKKNGGKYVDIYDDSRQQCWMDIPLWEYVLGTDKNGHLYYKTSHSSGSKVYWGKLDKLPEALKQPIYWTP